MNEGIYILFDQYLQGELSIAEKLNFEKQLSENQELAAAFATFKEVNEQLEVKFGLEKERNAFVDNLKTISNEHFNAPKSKVWYF